MATQPKASGNYSRIFKSTKLWISYHTTWSSLGPFYQVAYVMVGWNFYVITPQKRPGLQFKCSSQNSKILNIWVLVSRPSKSKSTARSTKVSSRICTAALPYSTNTCFLIGTSSAIMSLSPKCSSNVYWGLAIQRGLKFIRFLSGNHLSMTATRWWLLSEGSEGSLAVPPITVRNKYSHFFHFLIPALWLAGKNWVFLDFGAPIFRLLLWYFLIYQW